MPQPSEPTPAAKRNKQQADAPARSQAARKAALVLDLLGREQGATLAELVGATGWQPHSARAMLTGLRKKGHAVERGKRGDVTCYQLAVVTA
jgi:DNA-binding IclR family transcriptional regulator